MAGGGGWSTIRMASSKTRFRPFCVSAEHSRYRLAPISTDMSSPSWKVIGVCPCVRSRSFATWRGAHAIRQGLRGERGDGGGQQGAHGPSTRPTDLSGATEIGGARSTRLSAVFTWQRRRSSFVPTRMSETPGQCALSSGHHCDASAARVMQVHTRVTVKKSGAGRVSEGQLHHYGLRTEPLRQALTCCASRDSTHAEPGRSLSGCCWSDCGKGSHRIK